MIYIDRHKEHNGFADVTPVYEYINAYGDISTEPTTMHPDVLDWVRMGTGKREMSEEDAARVIWQAVLDHMQYPGSGGPEEEEPNLLGFMTKFAGSNLIYLFIGVLGSMSDTTKQTIGNAIDVLKTKTHDELALLIAGWDGALQDGFTLEDWEEAVAMAKLSKLIDDDSLLSVTYQLLIIYRRYRDVEKRQSTASTTHSPTQTER